MASAEEENHCYERSVDDVENATETVVAKLVYDEKKDALISAVDDDNKKDNESLSNGDLNGLENSLEAASSSSPRKDQDKIMRINPIFEAFADAEGVDDLYRIAEFYVQPSYLYNQQQQQQT